MEIQWRDLRHHLFNALSNIEVVEIYCIHKENNLIDLCIILKENKDVQKLQKLTQLRVIDRLIEKHCPEIYKSFLFTYEVWNNQAWGNEYVKRVLHRQTTSR